MIYRLNYTSYMNCNQNSQEKQTAELLYRVNPFAVGMTECERRIYRTKSRLAGWTDSLGTDAQNMSQRTADQRRRVASEVGSRSLSTPPNSIYLPCRSFFPCSFTFSLSLCQSTYTHSLLLFPSHFSLNLLLTLFSDLLATKSTIRKATSGFYKETLVYPKNSKIHLE